MLVNDRQVEAWSDDTDNTCFQAGFGYFFFLAARGSAIEFTALLVVMYYVCVCVSCVMYPIQNVFSLSIYVSYIMYHIQNVFSLYICGMY